MTPSELKAAQEEFRVRHAERKPYGYKEPRQDNNFLDGFDAFRDSPEYIAMKDALEFYANGEHVKVTTDPELKRGESYTSITVVEEIERGNKAREVLRAIEPRAQEK